MRITLLEDTLQDKVEQALDDPEVVSHAGQIESELDRSLDLALDAQETGSTDFPNLLFVGPAGTGKTARVKAWAQKNNINLVLVNCSSMDDTDLGGAIAPDDTRTIVKRLASTEMDELDEVPNSVLFLDELNRGSKGVRASLLTLVQDHTIRDDRVRGKQRRLKNFLFTVAAINPADENYDVDQLDDAEMGRFDVIQVYHDKLNTLNHLVSEFTRRRNASKRPGMIAEYDRKINLVKALLGSKDFKFDSPEDIRKSKEHGNGLILTARTLTNCLVKCDGTKDDFLKKWSRFCNSTKKSMAEQILKNYQDIDDKANDALKGGTTSSVFNSHTETDWDKINSLL